LSDFDLVVVGAGIHGAGVAQAGAAAGLRVLLLEERAVAWGTSSRSSKLIHGGLRYLESAQFGLVRESLAERKILLNIAPHLVRLVDFHLPVYRQTTRRPWKLRAGLSLYSLLGGFGADTRFASLPREQWDNLDGLRREGLQAVLRYRDGQTDDAALTQAVVQSARHMSCEYRGGARWLSAQRDTDAYAVHWSEGATVHECSAATLVIAGGPWTSSMQQRCTPLGTAPEMELVGGAHLELEGELTRGIYYVEAPKDRRAVFVMPWRGHTLVGTTETAFVGAPETVEPSAAEVEYLGECLEHYFPAHPAVFLAAWAGLRVLPRGERSAFWRPREVQLAVDSPGDVRRVCIYGGKLTGYRATAVKVLERLRESLPERARKADTKTLRLP
jgi:glycerol-3-phosphate dehydrogenase